MCKADSANITLLWVVGYSVVYNYAILRLDKVMVAMLAAIWMRNNNLDGIFLCYHQESVINLYVMMNLRMDYLYL